MESNTIVTYRGLGCTVVLDIEEATVAITHYPPSEHTGTWVVPLIEIEDVHYRERTADGDGWAQIRTVTTPSVEELAFDPYAFRNGGEQLKTFCLLIIFVTVQIRNKMEGDATRGALSDELTSMRQLLNRFRNK